jgi:uncharacterized protein
MLQIQLSEEHLKKIKTILRHYFPTSQIWLFGSRVTGTAKKYSDLDILIKIVEHERATASLIKLKHAFDDSDLPFQIDIVDWDKTSAEFREMVLKEAIILI